MRRPGAVSRAAQAQRAREANVLVGRAGRNTVTRTRMLPHRTPAPPRPELHLQLPPRSVVGLGSLVPDHKHGRVPEGGLSEGLGWIRR